VIRPLRVLVGLVASAVACAVMAASPAQATESEYLQALQPKFTFLSAQQLLDEGHKVCRVIGHNGNGMTAPDTVIMVSNDLAVSMEVADEIVATAVVDLPC
jgi:hypothetical protein